MRSYMAYTPRSGDRREYIAESGVYVFNRKGCRGVYLAIHNCSTEKRIFFFLFCNGMANRRATASTIEPPYSVLAQQPKRRTIFQVIRAAIQCLLGQTLLLPGS